MLVSQSLARLPPRKMKIQTTSGSSPVNSKTELRIYEPRVDKWYAKSMVTTQNNEENFDKELKII